MSELYDFNIDARHAQYLLNPSSNSRLSYYLMGFDVKKNIYRPFREKRRLLSNRRFKRNLFVT